jgi:DNA helicase TIP49 (TBP-interacting protein)
MQARAKNQTTQSDSFLKLRRRMQNQMRKNNVSHGDILKWTKEIKGEQNQ